MIEKPKSEIKHELFENLTSVMRVSLCVCVCACVSAKITECLYLLRNTVRETNSHFYAVNVTEIANRNAFEGINYK